MYPRITNLPRQARDAHELGFESTGAPMLRTNTQGTPPNPLSTLPSQRQPFHVPSCILTHSERTMQQEITTHAAFVGTGWADRKHDFVVHVQGRASTKRAFLSTGLRPSTAVHKSSASASAALPSPSPSSSPAEFWVSVSWSTTSSSRAPGPSKSGRPKFAPGNP